MKRRLIIFALLASLGLLVITGAGTARREKAAAVAPEKSPAVEFNKVPVLQFDKSPGAEYAAPQEASNAMPYSLDLTSVNGGGAIDLPSTEYSLGMSIGQGVAGFVMDTVWELGIGYWGSVGGQTACPIVLPGDVQQNGGITSGDIIYLVNFVFKLGPDPLPCVGAGDINCNGTVTSGDIISLVNRVFKNQPLPCDVCTVIPGTWSCP